MEQCLCWQKNQSSLETGGNGAWGGGWAGQVPGPPPLYGPAPGEKPESKVRKWHRAGGDFPLSGPLHRFSLFT